MKRERILSLGIIVVLALVATTQVPKAKALMIIGAQGTIQQVLGDEEHKDEKEVKVEERKVETKKEEKKLPEVYEVKVQTQEMKQEMKQMEEKKQEEVKKEGEKQREEEVKKEQERVRERVQEKTEEHRKEASRGGEKKREFEREIFKNGVKIKVEYKDGKLVIKREYANGQEEYVGEDKEVDVESQKAGKIRLKVEGENGLVIQGKKVKAKLELPVSVNPDTNELVVTTPAGSKVVTILPDKAVDRILGKAVEAVDQVRLTNYQEEPAYEVEGVDEQKLLGLFKVRIPKEVVVSATTGKVVTTQQSLVSKLLDLFAF